VRGEKKD